MEGGGEGAQRNDVIFTSLAPAGRMSFSRRFTGAHAATKLSSE